MELHLRIDFDNKSSEDISTILQYLQKENEYRLNFSASDAARWAISEQAKKIRRKSGNNPN